MSKFERAFLEEEQTRYIEGFRHDYVHGRKEEDEQGESLLVVSFSLDSGASHEKREQLFGEDNEDIFS